MGTTPATAATTAAAQSPILSSTEVFWVLGLFALIILVVAVLVACYLKWPRDYFTWFVLHFGVGVFAMVGVVLLALEGRLDQGATAIITSIVAYTFGMSAGKSTKNNNSAFHVQQTGSSRSIPKQAKGRNDSGHVEEVRLAGDVEQTGPVDEHAKPAD